jgi:hypothetical protein
VTGVTPDSLFQTIQSVLGIEEIPNCAIGFGVGPTYWVMEVMDTLNTMRVRPERYDGATLPIDSIFFIAAINPRGQHSVNRIAGQW